MIETLDKYRFELFFITLMAVLFGNVLLPFQFYENTLFPLLFIANVLTGILLVRKKQGIVRILIAVICVIIIFGLLNLFISQDKEITYKIPSLVTICLYYLLVIYELINQVWQSTVVDKKVLIGLISGFVSLGFLFSFIFFIIELLSPGSFTGAAVTHTGTESGLDTLMYFSYITLMTIGYGDIFPATALAHKVTVFAGLLGQFYLIIVTAVVIGKYMRGSRES